MIWECVFVFLCLWGGALVPRWKCLVWRRAGNLQPPVIYARRSEPSAARNSKPAPTLWENEGGTSIIWNQISQRGDNVSVICSPNDGCAWRFFDEPEHADETANQALHADVFHPIRRFFSISLCETPHYGGVDFSRRVVICKIAGVKSLNAEIRAQFAWHSAVSHYMACLIILNAEPWKVKVRDWLK